MRRRRSNGLIAVFTAAVSAAVIAFAVPLMTQGGAFRGDAPTGKVLYETHCQRCHGRTGLGDGPRSGDLRVPPANLQSATLQAKSDEQLLTSIEFGVVTSPMHAWRGQLSEQELREVLSYVRRLGAGVR
ncbi:MAG TPA: cytochrome c [Nitrospiraceae bacterium]|jgi:mono/diheme cytochrome c family protein|nr:cytochrome c [Nitrospiraceae bacterium]